jgi:hypothetical protein
VLILLGLVESGYLFTLIDKVDYCISSEECESTVHESTSGYAETLRKGVVSFRTLWGSKKV